MHKILLMVYTMRQVAWTFGLSNDSISGSIHVVDMTKPTSWMEISKYQTSLRNLWKICTKCGVPSLGTVIHMELIESQGSLQPALIPADYLLSRLVTIDVSHKRADEPSLILPLDVVQQHEAMTQNITEPTLLLFKFGWSEADIQKMDFKHCACKVPGLSYELAEWIATNLTHVVGVGTDAPTLESEETKEFAPTTVANLFATNGIYMIENVLFKRKALDKGCMALATPMKIMHSNYVPARLIAYCPEVIGNKTENVKVVLVQGNPRKTELPTASPPLPYYLRVNLTDVINYIVGIH